MKSLNEQLKDLYVTKFREGSPCFLQQLREKRRHENIKEQPAYPLLLKINEDRYQEADLKIMIFGQETNSWELNVVPGTKLTRENGIDYSNNEFIIVFSRPSSSQ